MGRDMDPFHFIHLLSACRNTDMEVTMIEAMPELLYRSGNKKATKSADHRAGRELVDAAPPIFTPERAAQTSTNHSVGGRPSEARQYYLIRTEHAFL